MNKIVLSFLLASATLGAILETKQTRTTRLSNAQLKVHPERKLTDNEAVASPEAYFQQLQSTNSHMTEMSLQSKRQDELNLLQNNFDDIERKLDQFRDGLAKKLNELQMGIQRPKIPVIGPGPFMMHPFMNPISNPGSAVLNNPVTSFQQISSFVPAPSFVSTHNPYSSRYSSLNQSQAPATQSVTTTQQTGKPRNRK